MIMRILAVFMMTLFAASAMAADSPIKTATFAGGCFWCMEGEFSAVPGVTNVVSGYTGGQVANPTYEQVSKGGTGHVEAIQIMYDPTRVQFEELLEIFWRNIDPLDENGQFCDKGAQYRAGIFYHDDKQKAMAEASRERVAVMFNAPVATIIKPAGAFYPAEDYHQDYSIKNPDRYKRYAAGCGREAQLERLWNDKKESAE